MKHIKTLVQVVVWTATLIAMFGCGDKLTMEKAARNCYTNQTGGLTCPDTLPR